MNRLIPIALALGLTACAANQVSGSLLSAYDGAVALEVGYLDTGKATPAQATQLRQIRLDAYTKVQAVVAAEKAGGSTAALQAVANAAISELIDRVTKLKGM